MRRTSLLPLLGLVSAGLAGAQTAPITAASPSPSASGTADYILFFSPSMSTLLSDNLNFSPSTQQSSGGCTLTGKTDGANGPIICVTADSCNPGGQGLPVCGAAFTGPPGLQTSDVAQLQPVSPSGSPTPGPSPSIAPGAVIHELAPGQHSFYDAYMALHHH